MSMYRGVCRNIKGNYSLKKNIDFDELAEKYGEEAVEYFYDYLNYDDKIFGFQLLLFQKMKNFIVYCLLCLICLKRAN